MAYFVLPGTGKRVYRLAVARRIVDASARGARDRSPAGLARRRTRVLRRAMRPSRRLHIGLGPWLRALPTRLPDPALTAALAKLHPHVRVAYVLRHVEGLPRYAVHDQLVELRIRDPWPAIRAADAVRPPAARRADRFEPALLRPVRNRSVLPLVTAAVLTAALVAVLVATERGDPREPELRLVSAGPGAWTGGARTLDAWPARGDLARDRAFTRGAAAAWAAAPAGRRATGTAQLLYAGNVGGTALAVLRQGGRVARYTRGGLDVVDAGQDTSAPIALGGGRYLLAPWDARPETLAGDALAVTDGVTAPARAESRCGRGPLFHVGSRTLGDLGGPRATVLSYHSPAYRPDGKDEPARLGRGGREFWNRLACAPHRPDGPDRPVTEAMAWNFWSGGLPRGGGSADWVCTRLTFADGAGAAAATLLAAKDRATGPCDARRPVSGTWWKAPSGRWYYLAAAGPGLVPHADGVRRSTVRKRLLTATGTRDAQVELTAR
ncbi:hypothetical protein [Actinomadura livida]|uniref:Uncharacterized protein n=1 Tax=Actinomadura livida TaxID=79909 RepID=A0A7W7MX68_9ACTN|nr:MULTISPECIES: hypothetical protein [Actinomadura]MBB4774353.1 hypothetical protein [Actinomadura catellatispora]GGT83173.1 hypothetical protein GCM10010208_01950 [Actinomadura livida]